MSTVTPKTSTTTPTFPNWLVTYLDGRRLSDGDVTWNEISVPRQQGTETLSLLAEPAASLTAIVRGRAHTLRAPDQDTHFFRYYRARTSLVSNQSELLYHAIGYISSRSTKVTLEIDTAGNSQLRLEYLEDDTPHG